VFYYISIIDGFSPVTHTKFFYLVILCFGMALFGQACTELPRKQLDRTWWYVLQTEGQKPNRSVYYIRDEIPHSPPAAESMANLLSGGKIYKTVTVTQVHESASGPGTISTEYDARCDTGQLKVNSIYTVWRQNTHSRDDPGSTEWKDAKAGLPAQIKRFACTEDKGSLVTPSANGPAITPLGPIPSMVALDHATWATQWPDAQPVAYTTKYSKAEVTARADAVVENGRKQVATMQTEANASLSKTKGDMARQAAEYKRIQDRQRLKELGDAYPWLTSWLGATEQQVLQAWGNPGNVLDAPNSGFHALVYRRGYVRQLQSGGQVVSSSENYCDFQFEFTMGVVDDVRILRSDAGTCRSESINFPDRRVLRSR
jgi:hypothetical protein